MARCELLFDEPTFILQSLNLFDQLTIFVPKHFNIKHVLIIQELLLLHFSLESLNLLMMLSFHLTNYSEPNHVVIGDFDLSVFLDFQVLPVYELLNVGDVFFVLTGDLLYSAVLLADLLLEALALLLLISEQLLHLFDYLVGCL